MSKKQKIVFSVIIPCYNEEKYLSSCLKSLLSQDFPKDRYEIVVVNNASNDKTAKIAKKFKVKVVNEPKKGVVYARQTGLKTAKGKYIVNTDADCLVPKNWLSTIYKDFSQNKDIIAVAGPTFSKGKDFYSQVVLKIAVKINALFYHLFKSPLGVWAANLSIKRSTLRKIGGYNSALPQFADQLELASRLKKVGRIYFDKDLFIQESDRRYKNRVLSFLLKDVFYYNFLNYYLYKLIGRSFGSWDDIR